jgi:hypothetical protein
MSGNLAYNLRLARYVLGFFDMSQIRDMGQTALLPFRRKTRPKKSDGFGANPRSWVPENSMLTTSTPKPLVIVGTIIVKLQPADCNNVFINILVIHENCHTIARHWRHREESASIALTMLNLDTIPRQLNPRKRDAAPTVQEAGWNQEQVRR